MISYSWAQQALVLKLKEKLEEKGFSIWFDTEQMAKYKSMPAAMGDGIANSGTFFSEVPQWGWKRNNRGTLGYILSLTKKFHTRKNRKISRFERRAVQ